jgi:hypothetical protein
MPLPRKADVGQYLPPSSQHGQEESVGWYGTGVAVGEDVRPWAGSPNV